ncbi:GDSL-type esterase/lipase family protein [Photobacterium kasasachensis]|uniref:SGNH/GDSL hydrolase family protein n=1 Tax=Photobacterium kasasachensis TaxID=2910240 RepID=UPI003D0E849B
MSLVKAATLMASVVLSSNVLATTISATDYRINYEGRHVKNWNEGNVELSWPGSSIQFEFSGTRLAVNLDGRGTQFDVMVDGEFSHILKTSAGLANYDLLNFPEEEEVHVELIKRNENYDAMIRVDSFEADGEIEGVWEQQPHILFYGDSITVGYGNESNKRECTTAEVIDTTNARLSYASIAADELDASRTLVAYSGLGMVRNWNGGEPYHNLPHYKNKAGSIFNTGEEYQDRHPDLVVINLGSNDFSTPLQPGEPWPDMGTFFDVWVNTYVDFILQQRARYGDVPILMISKDWFKEPMGAVEAQLAARNIEDVYSHYYMTEHLGCMGHPIESEHRVMADNLVKRIEELSLLD